MQQKSAIINKKLSKKCKKVKFYVVKQCKYVVFWRLEKVKKGWTSARLAAPANSVRKADEQMCEVGVAGLSLRDIT